MNLPRNFDKLELQVLLEFSQIENKKEVKKQLGLYRATVHIAHIFKH